jgi:thioredoxin-related protein
MRYLKSITLVLFLLTNKLLISQGINFNSEVYAVEEFENIVKKSKKPTLLIAFSSHCDICGHMDTAVYRKKEVGKFYNKNFNICKIDLEKEFANAFISKYQIYGYPTYLFFNTNGVLMHRQKGGFPVKEFLELGHDAIDPDKQFLSASFKFQTGIREQELCKNLAESAKEMDDVDLQRKCVICYLDQNKNWESDEAVKFIFKFTESIQEPQFQFVIKNRSLFEKTIGAGKFSEKFDNIILKDIAENSYNQEMGILDTTKAKEFAAKYLPPFEIEKALWLFNSNELIRKNDTANYINSIFNYFSKFPSSNGYLITNLSQSVADLTNDTAYLLKALAIAQRSYLFMQDEKCYLNAADIAIKLNDYKKAYAILLEGQEYGVKEKRKFYKINDLIINVKTKI